MNWISASRMSVIKSVSENSDDGHKKIANGGEVGSQGEHGFSPTCVIYITAWRTGVPVQVMQLRNKDDPRRLPGPTPTPTEPLPQRRAGHSLSEAQFTTV